MQKKVLEVCVDAPYDLGIFQGPAMNRYQPPLYRPIVLLVYGFCIALGVVMLLSLLAGEGPPAVVAVLWWAVFAAVGYEIFFRTAYRLEIDSDTLVWRSILRSGRIPLSQLRRVRTRSSIAIFEPMVGRPVATFAVKGFRDFARALANRQPGLEVRIGWWARLAEWNLGASAWKSDGT
jgi:hypothetical protein